VYDDGIMHAEALEVALFGMQHSSNGMVIF
jgi:hypothetical protein